MVCDIVFVNEWFWDLRWHWMELGNLFWYASGCAVAYWLLWLVIVDHQVFFLSKILYLLGFESCNGLWSCLCKWMIVRFKMVLNGEGCWLRTMMELGNLVWRVSGGLTAYWSFLTGNCWSSSLDSIFYCVKKVIFVESYVMFGLWSYLCNLMILRLVWLVNLDLGCIWNITM